MQQEMVLCEAWERHFTDDTVKFYLNGREVIDLYAGSIGNVYDGVWRVRLDGDNANEQPRIVDQYALVNVVTRDELPADPIPDFDNPTPAPDSNMISVAEYHRRRYEPVDYTYNGQLVLYVWQMAGSENTYLLQVEFQRDLWAVRGDELLVEFGDEADTRPLNLIGGDAAQAS